MNPWQIINFIPDIIAKRETSPTDKWILLILDDKIQCLPAEESGTEGTPLIPITLGIAMAGFSGRQWDKVINRIKAYQKTHPDFYEDPAKIAGKTETKTKPEPEAKVDEAKTDPDPG